MRMVGTTVVGEDPVAMVVEAMVEAAAWAMLRGEELGSLVLLFRLLLLAVVAGATWGELLSCLTRHLVDLCFFVDLCGPLDCV
jgi:hypothetical protein